VIVVAGAAGAIADFFHSADPEAKA
jgi:hypothetical protein